MAKSMCCRVSLNLFSHLAHCVLFIKRSIALRLLALLLVMLLSTQYGLRLKVKNERALRVQQNALRIFELIHIEYTHKDDALDYCIRLAERLEKKTTDRKEG
jgi:hypothetical protein